MDTELDPARRTESIAFLARDFGECFEERRRCEDRIWDITKFTLAAYSTVVAVALGAHQYGLVRDIDLKSPAALVLVLAAAVGAFNYFLIIRTRVYFVLVTRYINEHRKFFLAARPLGFYNATQLYTDPSLPPFVSIGSTQTWAAILVAGLNALLLASAWWLLGGSPTVAGTLTFLLQAGLGMWYLMRREGKSAEGAVYGKK